MCLSAAVSSMSVSILIVYTFGSTAICHQIESERGVCYMLFTQQKCIICEEPLMLQRHDSHLRVLAPRSMFSAFIGSPGITLIDCPRPGGGSSAYWFCY